MKVFIRQGTASLLANLVVSILLTSAFGKRAKSERDILQEFYKETGGASWNNNEGWEENSHDFCSWYGVVCEGEPVDIEDDEESRKLDAISIPYNEDGLVIGLRLEKNNLIGRVPPSLWELPNLHNLKLSNNKVDVSFAGGSSDSLIELKMRATSTSSLSGISRFPNILSLDMSDTPLGNVQFPREILDLPQLRLLHLNSCELEGTLPDDIKELTQLRELHLTDNSFVDLIPGGLASLEQLEVLSLAKNHFGGILPSFLQDFPYLQELYLEENQLTGQLLPFNTQTSIHKLSLQDNMLSENIPANFLAKVRAPDEDGVLIRVNLDNNELGDFVPDSLDNLSDLPLKISLAGNKFTSFESETLCDNSKWQSGLVEEYGCKAILCPKNFFSRYGRQTENNDCDVCETGIFLGQVSCLDQDDRRALKSLFADTGGEHWNNKGGWLEEENVCEWFGIECYGDNHEYAGRVKHIDLHNNGLIGRVPDAIYTMDVLTKINLSWNSVQFQFSKLSDSSSLRILNIGHTDTTSMDGIQEGNEFFKYFLADRLAIDGTIPKEIYSNTNLKVISLANCGLSGTIGTEIGQLKDLEELYLWGNNLRGTIPSEITQLPNLRIVTFAKNQLTGTLPEKLEELENLKAFSITDQVTKGGGLTGELLPFQYNTDLSNVFLAKNKFAGSIPLTMLNSVDIEETIILDVSSNQVTGTVPGTLAKFDQMDLFVQDNMITRVDQALCNKRDWMYGGVGEWGCEAILCPAATYNELGRLAFDGMMCHDCRDQSVSKTDIGQTQCGGRASSKTERQILQTLYDSCNGENWLHNENWMSTGRHHCEWSGISCDDAKSVVAIVLGSNSLKGNLPTDLYQLPNLKRLYLFDNAITVSFDGIENAKELESLVLDSTIIPSIEGIGNARSLTELNLRSINYSGPMPSEIANLNNLEKLTMSNNNIAGPLPKWLSKLNKLTALMLENNKFSGELIPFEDYKQITLLSLANNYLSGPVPPLFLAQAYKDDKVFVDLSGNNLSGVLPKELSHMNRLSIVLTDNMISSIDPELCDMKGWNDYDVQAHGCDGILCPMGTYGDRKGRASGKTECDACSKSKYMGYSECIKRVQRSAGSSTGMAWSIVFALSSVLLFAM